jgi:hypothetical protein
VEQSVVVVRDGKRKTLPLGEAFDFTDEEVAQITAGSPEALRDPKDESKPAEEAPSVTVGAAGEKDAAEATKPSGPNPLDIDGPTKRGAKPTKTAPEATGTGRDDDL